MKIMKSEKYICVYKIFFNIFKMANHQLFIIMQLNM